MNGFEADCYIYLDLGVVIGLRFASSALCTNCINQKRPQDGALFKEDKAANKLNLHLKTLEPGHIAKNFLYGKQ